MRAPPGSSGPQLSPDGMYWWDGLRWVPLAQPYQAYPQPAPYRFPDPSPGLRQFLLVVLVIADVATMAFGALGSFVFAQDAGFLGPSDAAPLGPTDIVLWLYFQTTAALMLVATIGVWTRSGLWARIVTLVAAVAVSISCLGAVLGIPILIAAIRAPMTKPAPSG